uniref:Heparan-alpha-glucosaminide N-acetyltransferase catalytic domain-containing protein n=1 Tax=Aegilops tauschii TaxID=37682 RepID=M8BN48_AEGTA
MATAVSSPLVFFSFLFSVVACLARDASIGRPTRAAPPAQSQGADSPGPGDCGRISLCLLDVDGLSSPPTAFIYCPHADLLMIIVDDAGSFLPAMNHSPWEGVTIADFVMPFFLFIVGVALALAYKRVPDKLDATRKATLRALKLFCVGLVLQGGFFHGVRSLTFGVDITQIRLMGILQRIAIAYLVTALCQIWLKGDDDVDSGLDLIKRYRYQLLAGLLITITYMVLLYGTYVPDWEYRISGPGSTEKTFTQCSIDSPQNGPLPPDAPSWCQAPFDPEGLLRSEKLMIPSEFISSSCNFCDGHRNLLDRSPIRAHNCTFSGEMSAVHLKHRERIMHWLVPSFGMLVLAFAMDFFVEVHWD